VTALADVENALDDRVGVERVLQREPDLALVDGQRGIVREHLDPQGAADGSRHHLDAGAALHPRNRVGRQQVGDIDLAGEQRVDAAGRLADELEHQPLDLRLRAVVAVEALEDDALADLLLDELERSAAHRRAGEAFGRTERLGVALWHHVQNPASLLRTAPSGIFSLNTTVRGSGASVAATTGRKLGRRVL
jgi:hypothetical protein